MAQAKAGEIALPDRSEALQFDNAQAFAVAGPSFEPFWLLPVRYESEDPIPGHFSPRCGVFVIRGKGKMQFVRTIGYGRTNIFRCNKLKGVGFVAGQSQPPRILLLYDAQAPNFVVLESEILDWDAAKAEFVEDDALGERLEGYDKADIPWIKRQLKK